MYNPMPACISSSSLGTSSACPHFNMPFMNSVHSYLKMVFLPNFCFKDSALCSAIRRLLGVLGSPVNGFALLIGTCVLIMEITVNPARQGFSCKRAIVIAIYHLPWLHKFGHICINQEINISINAWQTYILQMWPFFQILLL